MIEDFSYYGAKLKELRTDNGYTLREVSEKLNIDHSHVSRIEKGNFPSIPLLVNFLELYHLSLDEFFNENSEWNIVIKKLKEKGITPEGMLKFIDVIGKLN